MDFVHYLKSSMRSCAFLKDARGILCIFGSFSWEFVHFWKFLMGFCAFLEVLNVIFCIFGRNSQDVFEILHRIFWKFFMGFSAFLEVPHGIVRILEVPYEILCITGSS
jgi:hypothetical protein